ncbi:hypothetical protein DUI87_01754 [Hirundo rustica rustica]|uniref:Integrase-type domain-containing protein n=1 Tax=Hirundo rustica rustica TaxID=333673 RepID=A0A3M0L714_HIRRU|nr:hypothetical protein DUI87_01754 [Hirundo rustica rustica]
MESFASRNVEFANVMPMVAPEKVQQQPPWKYLGVKILERTIRHQEVQFVQSVKTLNDAQKLEPFNLITDSAYFADIAQRLGCSVLKEVSNPALFDLLKALWCAIQARVHPYYVLHVRSHTNLPGFVAEVLIVPRVLYHQEEEMYHFLEETILLRKREVMTGFNGEQQPRAKVRVRNLVTKQREGPYDLIAMGRGYVCVSTDTGTRWLPSKCVRPDLRPQRQNSADRQGGSRDQLESHQVDESSRDHSDDSSTDSD